MPLPRVRGDGNPKYSTLNVVRVTEGRMVLQLEVDAIMFARGMAELQEVGRSSSSASGSIGVTDRHGGRQAGGWFRWGLRWIAVGSSQAHNASGGGVPDRRSAEEEEVATDDSLRDEGVGDGARVEMEGAEIGNEAEGEEVLQVSLTRDQEDFLFRFSEIHPEEREVDGSDPHAHVGEAEAGRGRQGEGNKGGAEPPRDEALLVSGNQEWPPEASPEAVMPASRAGQSAAGVVEEGGWQQGRDAGGMGAELDAVETEASCFRGVREGEAEKREGSVRSGATKTNSAPFTPREPPRAGFGSGGEAVASPVTRASKGGREQVRQSCRSSASGRTSSSADADSNYIGKQQMQVLAMACFAGKTHAVLAQSSARVEVRVQQVRLTFGVLISADEGHASSPFVLEREDESAAYVGLQEVIAATLAGIRVESSTVHGKQQLDLVVQIVKVRDVMTANTCHPWLLRSCEDVGAPASSGAGGGDWYMPTDEDAERELDGSLRSQSSPGGDGARGGGMDEEDEEGGEQGRAGEAAVRIVVRIKPETEIGWPGVKPPEASTAISISVNPVQLTLAPDSFEALAKYFVPEFEYPYYECVLLDSLNALQEGRGLIDAKLGYLVQRSGSGQTVLVWVLMLFGALGIVDMVYTYGLSTHAAVSLNTLKPEVRGHTVERCTYCSVN
jgi:hypothetical protein